MTLVLSVAVAFLFGSGVHLMLRRDLIMTVAGLILISNAANLFVMSTGLSLGQPPIYPLSQAMAVSDPLVQALTLTAVVIGFGSTAIMLTLVYRLYISYGTIDQKELQAAEEREESELRFKPRGDA